jgi:hypothetical protein
MFPYELIYFATIFLIETHILHPFYPIAIFPITILVKKITLFHKKNCETYIHHFIRFIFSFTAERIRTDH